MLAKNFELSRKILNSTYAKLKQNPENKLYDDVFSEQVNLGIIERIENLNDFMAEHPECSFLPHMGVFKFSRETTKCRVVYLANLCQKKRFI